MENDLSDMRQLSPDFYMNEKKQLGKGSFGCVYEGYSKKKNIKIAVKVIIEKKLKTEQEKILLLRQIEALEILTFLNHDNIMGYYGNVKINGNYYLFLQYCPGGDLERFIKKNKDIDQQLVLNFYKSILDAMSYMNANKILHRDLAPKNILVCNIQGSTILKISDFGLARKQYDQKNSYLVDQDSPITFTAQRGTPLYQAPQVDYGSQYTQNCDVWSAGLILYEMLHGIHFQYMLKNYKQLQNFWKNIQNGIIVRFKKNKKVHPFWQYFYQLMMVFNKQKRYTFIKLQELLKGVYPKMIKEILENKNKQEVDKYINLEFDNSFKQIKLYFNHINQKINIILKLDQLIQAQPNFNTINQCVKLYLIFLTTLRSMIIIKNINKQIFSKNIKFPTNYNIQPNKYELPQNRLLLQGQSRNFQNINLQKEYKLEQIIKKLQLSSKQHSNIFSQMPKRHLFAQAKKKSMPTQKELISAYKLLVENKALISDKFKDKELGLEHLRIYLAIYIISNLETIIPQQSYTKEGFAKEKLQSLMNMNEQKTIELIIELSTIKQ